jgi:DNA-binding NarL/FixJ family response regulator
LFAAKLADRLRVSNHEGVRRTNARAQQERPIPSRTNVADVRVLAVDDHQAFRDALQDLVAAVPGFALVGYASSGEEALRESTRLSPDLVLMDVVMPGIGGIAAARAIVRGYPDVAILLLSVDDPAGYLGDEQLGDGVASLQKQKLSPDELRRVWDRLRNSADAQRPVSAAILPEATASVRFL